METNGHRIDKEGNIEPEKNYSAHQEDPSPSPNAIKEPDDRPASNTLWVAVIFAIVALVIFYLLFLY